MRRNKTRLYIFLLIITMFFLSIGYALFSETLAISGTANTSGTFDIQFTAATTSNVTGCTPTATVAVGGKSLTIDVADMQYPGATAQIDITVQNMGNVAAILQSVDVTGTDDTDITVTVPSIANTTLAATATFNFSIVVTWDSGSTAEGKSITFTVDLNWAQNTP